MFYLAQFFTSAVLSRATPVLRL